METVVNALRKTVNQEDKCDLAIKQALEKGPKRIRIASREELKIEINTLKNQALRIAAFLKAQKISVPSYIDVAALENKETGLREGADEKENNRDYLDAVSVGESNLSMGSFAEGEAGEMQRVEWLTEQNGKLEAIMKDKN